MILGNYDNYMKEALNPEQIQKKKELALASHMRMYLSVKLRDILKTMISPIAFELLSLTTKDIKFDVSFMDAKEGGMVTFINTMKVKKMEENGLDLSNPTVETQEQWTSSQRVQPTKINRILGKIFQGKFSPGQVEQFGNEFKAKESKQESKMKVVYGDQIRKYYLEDIHSKTIVGGTLKGSCMRYKDRQTFFDMYCKNVPGDGIFSHVGLLILLDDDNKLIARALIWFNSVRPEPGRIFMDRIYYMRDSDEITFIDYAKSNGWLYKQNQTFNNANYMDPKDNKKHGLTLTFRLKPQTHKKYPFMDTLVYFTPETGRLSSKQNKNRKYPTYRIQEQYGGATQI